MCIRDNPKTPPYNINKYVVSSYEEVQLERGEDRRASDCIARCRSEEAPLRVRAFLSAESRTSRQKAWRLTLSKMLSYSQ
jgi:hypothetical protein